jgi:hypothetical protein
VSNQLRASGSLNANGNPLALETFSADFNSSVTIVTLGAKAGVLIRYTDANNFIAWLFGSDYPLNKIVKVEGGVLTELADGDGGTVVAGDTVTIQGNSDSISVFVGNGDTLYGSAFGVTFNQTATKHGILLGDTTTVFDDYNGTLIAGGGGS